MPRRTIWVREEDVDIFDNLPDRPEWIHQSIQFAADLAEIKAKGSIERGDVTITHAEAPADGGTVYEPLDDMP